MDQRLDTLESILGRMTGVMADAEGADLTSATPCDDYDVAALLDHLAVWVQVFAGAVNDSPPDFNPMDHHVTEAWSAQFGESAGEIVSGLRERGFDRPMTMTSDPMPGEYFLSMMLMEYVAHGWDLLKATGGANPYSEDEVSLALSSAEAIVEPQYREYGMFGAEVEVPDDAATMERFVAFLGRDPAWG